MSTKPIKLTQLSEKIQWVHLGQVKRLIRFFKQNNVHRAVMSVPFERRGYSPM
jgi:DUF1009 family protein